MISTRALAISGVIVALVCAAVASPFASSSPDGLEKVAEEHGLAAAEQPAWTTSPIPEYAVPGIAHEGLATGSAGLIGTLVVLALGFGLSRLLVKRRQPSP